MTFSAMLVGVRNRLFIAFFLLVACGAPWHLPTLSQQAPQQAPAQPASQQPPQQTPPSAAPKGPTETQAPTPAPSQPTRPTLSVVVLDPGHGGADAGARGPSGILESEVVLGFARLLRAELERQGLRVVLTRQGNDNPSFDDRSAVANAQRGSLFITLHVSSTGPIGTARAYTLPWPAPQGSKAPAATMVARSGLLPWDEAQRPYLEMSRRLAELVQIQLAQKFRGSPEVPETAAVRQLRTIAAPAVAIEVSSVAVSAASQLEQMAPGLAEAVGRAVAAFKIVHEGGGK